MSGSQSALTRLLDRCRAAVVERAATPARDVEVPATASTLASLAYVEAPRAPRVIIPAPTPAASAPTPSHPSCELPAALLVGLRPGEARLYAALHRLGRGVCAARGYGVTPSSVVFHLPASLLALLVGVSRRTLYRYLPALVEGGLLAQGGHAARVGGTNLYDGCLWAVRLVERAPAPRLRREDWRQVWRDLSGDLKSGNTAQKLVAQLQSTQADTDEIYTAAERWAVTPGRTTPVEVSCVRAATDPREVVYELPALLLIGGPKRGERVGVLASALSSALHDAHSRRLYAALMHRAVAAEHRGVKALAQLQAALTRVLADLSEGAPWRRAGAVLVARLKVCGAWDAWASPHATA